MRTPFCPSAVSLAAAGFQTAAVLHVFGERPKFPDVERVQRYFVFLQHSGEQVVNQERGPRCQRRIIDVIAGAYANAAG